MRASRPAPAAARSAATHCRPPPAPLRPPCPCLQLALLACLALAGAAAAAPGAACAAEKACAATACGTAFGRPAEELPYDVEYTTTADSEDTTFLFKVGTVIGHPR